MVVGCTGVHGGGVQCQNSTGSRLLSPRGSSALRGTGLGPRELPAGVQLPVGVQEEEGGGERLWWGCTALGGTDLNTGAPPPAAGSSSPPSQPPWLGLAQRLSKHGNPHFAKPHSENAFDFSFLYLYEIFAVSKK